MTEERDWRREAIYWRFLFGDGAAAISQAWDIGLEQVEHELRAALRVAPAFQPAMVGGRAQLVTRPRPVRRRRAAQTRRQATPKAATREKAGRQDWQAQARRALALASHSAAIQELVTRLRIPDAERKNAGARLWPALQALVKAGEVVRTGTRYQLAKKAEVA